MQVWGNQLKNNQTQSKWLGCKTWWGIRLSLGYRLWFSSYLLFNISALSVNPQKSHFWEKVGRFNTIKKSAKFMQKKGIC